MNLVEEEKTWRAVQYEKHTCILILMVILPWLSIAFIGKKSPKKYVLAAITISVYLVLEGRFAEKKKWWWFPYDIKHNVLAELPLNYRSIL